MSYVPISDLQYPANLLSSDQQWICNAYVDKKF